MPTKEQIAAKILPRVTSKTLREFQWVDVVAAVGGASVEDKARLADAIRRNNVKGIGETIMRLVKDHAKTAAVTRVTAMLANSNLDLDELEQIL